MNVIKELAIILGISLIGEALNHLLPLPVPAGVYGLFLLLALLCGGIVKLSDVDGCGNFLLDNISPMFIPAGVGIIRYKQELMEVGIPYLVINVISTWIVFIVTGWVVQKMMRGEEKGEKNK